MALIKSTILSAIRGSINGTTFSQNRYGAYARNRTVLANPNTGNQILARSSLSLAAQSWQTLSDAERLAWQNYATGTPVPNRLGDMVHLSGINMYVKTNAFYLFTGVGQLVAAPSTPGLANPILTVTASLSSNISTLPNQMTLSGWNGGSAAAESRYGSWISHPVSTGTTFFKGPWTYVGPFTGDARIDPQTVPFDMVAGQLFFIRLRYIDPVGKMSLEFITGPVAAGTVV